jgi:hypothetical protein
MYFFTSFVYNILNRYRNHLILFDSIPVGFTGVASERPAPAFTNEISDDALFFAAGVNFTNANALVRVQSLSPQYDWMADNRAAPQDTPITCLAGIPTGVTPMLPLVQPYFLKRQGRLRQQFTNSATAPTTGGLWTWAILKLIDPIDGGWDYSMGIV